MNMKDDEVKQLLKECYELLKSEYGDNWKRFSNDSQLKKVMIGIEKQLGD